MLIDGAAGKEAAMAIDVGAGRRLFTRTEYGRMGEAGILREGDRVELIEGEILTMTPIGRRHRAFSMNLNRLLTVALDGRAVVATQLPLALSEYTEPEPDVAVYRLRRDVPYKEREAVADDALLVIEIADTSLGYDRSIKLRLYAAAGIPEYWIVDCAVEAIDVYRGLDAGAYRDVSRVTGGAAAVSPQAFPDVTLTLSQIFA
jgi:Uma2 family endonuclease